MSFVCRRHLIAAVIPLAAAFYFSFARGWEVIPIKCFELVLSTTFGEFQTVRNESFFLRVVDIIWDDEHRFGYMHRTAQSGGEQRTFQPIWSGGVYGRSVSGPFEQTASLPGLSGAGFDLDTLLADTGRFGGYWPPPPSGGRSPYVDRSRQGFTSNVYPPYTYAPALAHNFPGRFVSARRPDHSEPDTSELQYSGLPCVKWVEIPENRKLFCKAFLDSTECFWPCGFEHCEEEDLDAVRREAKIKIKGGRLVVCENEEEHNKEECPYLHVKLYTPKEWRYSWIGGHGNR